MALDEQSIRNYCKITDIPDSEVAELITAAETYIINAIDYKDKTVLENDPVFCLCVKMLVSHWYDNRGVMLTGTILRELPYGIQSLILQLSCGYDTEVT